MKKKNNIIGVDIGGTKIAAGIISNKGDLGNKVTIPTCAGEGKEKSLKQVISAIEQVIESSGLDKKSFTGIGVCAPGPLDPIKGIVQNPPNLPGWVKVPLASIIKKKFKINTKLENDANAAGVAEMVWGAAKGYKNIVYVTISTGIGTGIIINGSVYHGKNGMAGEGGHVCIDYKDSKTLCGCGRPSCVEAIASGPATAKRLLKKLKNPANKKSLIYRSVGGDLEKITMKTVAKAARNKDKLAIETIEEQGKIIGIWLAGMISILDPEIIVIGGGVSSIGKMIFDPIRRTAYERSVNVYANETPIVRAKLQSSVGIYDAAAIVK